WMIIWMGSWIPFSCLWLELFPPVILLASVSTPGLSTLTCVPVVRALTAGKLSSYSACVQKFGALIHLLSPGVIALPVGQLSSAKEEGILSFCPHRQEHTRDNRNLLRQKLYCLLLQEDPDPRKWSRLYSPQPWRFST
ncbi:mCG144679, partial [Mus musculus]